MMAERAKVERGQAPDPTGRSCADTVAVQPAPASELPTGETERRPPVCGAKTVDFDGRNFVCHRPDKHAGDHYDNLSDHRWSAHCRNCGLVLGSDRPYCDVCGCLATTHDGKLQCTKAKGHVLHHLNGCETWYGDKA